MSSDTTGSSNAAYGYNALASNLTGNGDTAIGYGALDAQMSGDFNIGLGLFAGNGVTHGQQCYLYRDVRRRCKRQLLYRQYLDATGWLAGRLCELRWKAWCSSLIPPF